jgi:hypothetical protein
MAGSSERLMPARWDPAYTSVIEETPLIPA